jgi:hypothetical protein
MAKSQTFITVKSNLDDTLKQFGQLTNEMKGKALARAMKRTGERSRTIMTREVRKDYNVAMNSGGSALDDPDVMLYEAYSCDSERNYTGYCDKDMQARFDHVVCFSATNFTGTYTRVMNPKLCYSSYDEEVLANVLRIQSANPEKRVMVILDDVLGTDAGTSRAVRALFSEGRHLRASCFMLSQVANRVLTPLVKQQSRFIVLKMIYDEVKIRPATTFRQFCAWVDEHLVKHTFGVWDAETKRVCAVRAPAITTTTTEV